MKQLRRIAARIVLVTYTTHRILGTPVPKIPLRSSTSKRGTESYYSQSRSINPLGKSSWPSALALAVLLPVQLAAQSSPWGRAAEILANEFSGPIARGFSIVAIVVGGLSLAFSDGSGKRMIGGLVFGCGLALGAVQFITFLFV